MNRRRLAITKVVAISELQRPIAVLKPGELKAKPQTIRGAAMGAQYTTVHRRRQPVAKGRFGMPSGQFQVTARTTARKRGKDHKRSSQGLGQSLALACW